MLSHKISSGGTKFNGSDKMEKAEDQSILSNKAAPFLNHQRDRVPAVLIVGQ